MNTLAWHSRASVTRRPCSAAGSSTAHRVAAVARHRRTRPVDRQVELLRQPRKALPSSTPAAATARCPDRSPRPAPRAATACSRRTAPASGSASRATPAPPRRIEPRNRSRHSGDSDQPSPAMWCSSSSSTCSSRPARTGAPEAAAQTQARSRAPPPQTAHPKARPRRPPPPRTTAQACARISWRGTPARSGKTVRRLS